MNNLFHKKSILALLFVSIFAVGVMGFTVSPASAQDAEAEATDSIAVTFKNPLGQNTVDDVITKVLNSLRTIIIAIAMIFIVIAGILYMTSGGNEGRMTVAKGAFLAAMIGLAIAIAAPSFLLEIYNALGAGDSNAVPAPEGIALSAIALNILNFLLGIVGTLAIIMLVGGGVMMLMSRGNETQIESAKKTITYAVVGIAVSIGALLIVRLIGSLFA